MNFLEALTLVGIHIQSHFLKFGSPIPRLGRVDMNFLQALNLVGYIFNLFFFLKFGSPKQISTGEWGGDGIGNRGPR